jgi:hypothetical protein
MMGKGEGVEYGGTVNGGSVGLYSGQNDSVGATLSAPMIYVPEWTKDVIDAIR